MDLKHLSIYSVIWRIFKSGSPRSMHKDSMLQANAGSSCFHTHASRLSSKNMAFLVGPCFTSAKTPLLILSSFA